VVRQLLSIDHFYFTSAYKIMHNSRLFLEVPSLIKNDSVVKKNYDKKQSTFYISALINLVEIKM